MSTADPQPDHSALELTDASRRSLIHVLRVMFPHDSFPDGPYERTTEAVLEAAADSTWSFMSLVHGLGSLDALCDGAFADLDEPDALRILLRVEHMEFFDLIRRTAVVALYDDHEVWELLGYEGPSFDKGGYLHRGFDDLDWLPDPRIEEYDGPEPFVEVATPPSAPAEGGAR